MYADKFHVDILLFWEHKDREIEVITEISKQLRKKYGLSVAIASTVYDRFFSLFCVKPKVVVFHSNKSLPPLFYTLYGEQIAYICLNWEQMLSVFNKIAAKKADDYLNRNLMKNFAWGKKFSKFLQETGVPAKNIFITGRPALTLLRRKMLNKARIRDEIAGNFGLDKNRLWLFFPLTCLHAFFDDRTVINYVRNKLISNQVDIDLAFARRNYVRKTVLKIFVWLGKLSSTEIENFHIILRPHPLVSVKQHIKLFHDIHGQIPPNVSITKDLTAQDWLVASDACYTNYSSLALDAYFVGKPAFLIEPEPFPDFLRYEWFNGFARVKTCSELTNSMNYIEKWRYSQSEVIENQFDGSLDGIAESAKLIARAVKEIERYPSIFFRRLIREIKRAPKETLNLASLSIYFAFKTNFRKKRIPLGREKDFVDSWEFKRLLA